MLGRHGRWTAALVLAAALLAQGAGAATRGPPPPVDRRAGLILVRSALTALDQANKTGNYTVLRDLGGPVFRANTDARLAEAFAGLRSQSVDLSPVLAVEPVFTLPPQRQASGLLRAVGFVPDGARRLNFEIAWQAQDGAWRLYGVVVTVTDLAPAARK